MFLTVTELTNLLPKENLFTQENNEDCLPCLFIQFCVIENGRRVSKILQIFSRQAVQMDALVATFVEDLKQRVAGMYNEDPEGNMFNDSSSTEADGREKRNNNPSIAKIIKNHEEAIEREEKLFVSKR